ncbi:MAG: KpsF/GutQ family sugar-phosphate isomerase [Spirochaetota bacterium]
MSGNRSDAWSTALHVWNTAARELTRLQGTVDPEAFERCVEAIASCAGRVVTAGVGTSGAAAKKVAHSLSCIERPSFFLSPGDAVHGALGAVQSEDVAILFSKGGGTREVVNMIPALKTKQVFLIAVTENAGSVLAKEADLLLQVAVEGEADEFNMLATTSTMAVTAVFDAVAIALMKRTGYTKEQFAVIHPGGAVGERLLAEHKER